MSGIQISTENEKELHVYVRMSGALAKHVQACTGPDGLYENNDEYIRDLVRRDMTTGPGFSPEFTAFWEQLLPGVMADHKQFKPMSRQAFIDSAMSEEDIE